MISIPAFYSDNPSSNPAGYLNFLYKKTKIKEKEAGVGPSIKKWLIGPVACWSKTHVSIEGQWTQQLGCLRFDSQEAAAEVAANEVSNDRGKKKKDDDGF